MKRLPASFAALILALCLLLFPGCGTDGGTGGAAAPGSTSTAPRAVPAFDTGLAMEHVRQLSVDIGPRVSGTPAEHRAAEYINGAFSGMGYPEVVEQAFTSGPGRTSYNVYVEDLGERPEWVIVVGAHYDSADATGSPGANDNASGVGVVLELARSFRSVDNLPTLIFVAFGSEEVAEEYEKGGLEYGSAYLADHLEDVGGKVIGMVNLDMVGVGEEAFAYATLEAADVLSDLFLEFAGEQGERVGFIRDPGDWSDNESFEAAGVSSFTLEWQFDPDYHTPRDVYGNVEPSLISESGRLIAGFLAGLDAFDCRLLERSSGRAR